MSLDGMDGILAEFVEEGSELINDAESRLMAAELERVSGRSPSRETFDAIFRAFHSLKGTAGFLDLHTIVEVNHEAETLLDKLRDSTFVLDPDKVTALCAALDFSREALDTVMAEGTDSSMEARAASVVHALVEASTGEADAEDAEGGAFVFDADVSAATLMPLDDEERTASVRAAEVEATVVEAAEDTTPEEQPPAPAEAEPAEAPAPPAPASPPVKAASPAAPVRRGSSIRVDTTKLDALMNLVGELILAEVMVTHSSDLEGLELDQFTKAARNLNRITRALQDIAMSVRMIPIDATFSRMQRLVRDVALQQGKQVELVLDGAQTEVDKNLIERVTDPLVHMIRNAVDHGIESPEERVAAGKAELGTLKLQALHASGEVWIVLSDDGRGLDRERIASKAVERGLITDARGLSDAQVFELIFEPGFSTATAVSSVSGRGVGMDVVKRNIEEVNGRVEIASRPGEGTTLTLKIPLTLAIIDGMLVRVGSQVYTLPLLAIQQSLQVRGHQVNRLPDGRETMRVRGRVLPLIRLHEVLEPGSAARDVEDGILIVCHHAGRAVALLADALLGQRQTVIKRLPTYLGQDSVFSGCSILSDGDISLILDLGALLARAGRPARSSRPSLTDQEAAA